MKPDRERRPFRLQRVKGGFSAADAISEEAMDGIRYGETVEVTIKRRRSLPQLKAYWAGLSRFVDATEVYPSAEHAHDAIKFMLGFTTPILLFSGEVVQAPDSVALGRMDGPAFDDFFRRAERLIIERYGFSPWPDRKADAA